MQQSTLTSESAPMAEGRIYNQYYGYYIFADFKFLGLGADRYVIPHMPFELGCGKSERQMKYSNRKRSAVWLFEPVVGRTNTFYLRNKKYINDYLRGSNDHYEIFFQSDNWVAWTSKKDRFDDEMYMWKFDRIENTDRYHIWNVGLISPLHVWRLNEKNMPYAVSLKDGPMQDSPKFEWVLKCLDDQDPVIT